jgi:hypothetical protein
VPPPALAVDPGQATRDGLIALLRDGWCEFEFDTAVRNGQGAPSDPPPARGPSADEETGIVN